MKIARAPSALTILLAAAALSAVVACQEAEKVSPPPQEVEASPPVRATPAGTITHALTAIKEERYSQIPALVSLAFALKPADSQGGAPRAATLEPADLHKVQKLLEDAVARTPRFVDNGRVAVFKVPGHGLPRDELRLVRLREKWYFLVE